MSARRLSRRLALGASVAALSLLTACGSTVQLSGTHGASDGSALGGDGLSLDPGPSPSETSAPAGDHATPTGDFGSMESPGEQPTDGASTPIDNGGFTGGGSGGATSTPKPIEIGTYYLDGGNSSLGAIGLGGLVIPDAKPLYDAEFKYLNAHGGLGGRKIVPVFHKYSSGGDPHAQDAAACATFTQDHHAYLVLGGISSGAGDLPACLTKHGVPLIGANQGGDATYFAKNHRYIYEPGQVNFTLALSTLVKQLASQGVLKKGSKVGVMQYINPSFDRAVTDGLAASLTAMGAKLVDTVKVEGTDNATIATAANSAVLRFAAAGIDRVVFMAPGGAAAAYFMIAAGNQGYHPHYGIWSADSPSVMALLAPKGQMQNSSGIGYQPGLDVGAAQDPTASTAAAKKCFAHWDAVGDSDRSGLKGALKRAMCDGFDTLKLAIAAQRDALTSTAALEAGYDSIGTSFTSAATFSMRFAAGAHDSANGYRLLSFDGNVYRYTGSTRLFR